MPVFIFIKFPEESSSSDRKLTWKLTNLGEFRSGPRE